MELLGLLLGIAVIIMAAGIAVYLVSLATAKNNGDYHINTTRFPTEPMWQTYTYSKTTYSPADEEETKEPPDLI